MKADHKKDELSADERSSEDEVYFNEYLSADYIDLHLMGRGDAYKDAISALCAGMGKVDHRAITCMNVLVANLLNSYWHYPERYVYLSLNEYHYRAKSIYNRNHIGYDNLQKCLRHLQSGYMTKTKPYFNRKYKDGYLTRIRATDDLISLIKEHGVTKDMLYVRDQEVVILKDMPFTKEITHKGKDGKVRKFKVKVTRLYDYSKDYVEHEHRTSLRRKIERYNELLWNSYIDIDPAGYVPKVANREPKSYDLKRKSVRRIFNRQRFTLGGRLYGGFWQQLPSDLRKHLIINGRPVIEVDYSGMHIHICYAMKGLKLRDLGLIPYIYTKNNDPDNVRPYIKRIMLTAINCNKPQHCLRAVRRDMKEHPENYPQQPENIGKKLQKLRDQVLKYHAPISEYLNSGIGLKAQFIDSEIAMEVITHFTKKNIPVLCVHDSFICSNNQKDELIDVMKQAYVNVVNREIIKKDKLALKIDLEDVAYDMDTMIDIINDSFSVYQLLAQARINKLDGFHRLQAPEEQQSSKSNKLALYIANNRHTIEYMKNPLAIKSEQYNRQLQYLESKICNFNEIVRI